MIRNIAIFALVFFLNNAFAQKAVNFTCNDCKGNSHDLFKNLDSGKVVVIDWVMPCASCIAPSKTAYNVVRSFDTIYPGKIIMYIVDDYANTACPSIESWANSNGMPNTIRFSNSLIKMMDYGSNGMPKAVVLAGKGHDVFFNENNSNVGNSTKLKNALISAVSATLSVKETNFNITRVAVNPNPANQNTNIEIDLKNTDKYSVEIIDIFGKNVKTIIKDEILNAGTNNIDVNTSELSKGMYFLKIYNSKTNKFIKILVCR
ncbi:MAG: T9SS type A sorting domain-containing protein [Bacteroidia bacterium]|nr:T9SS type A sorting domain-containing protein [Bacteroidia bacterium]